MAGFFDFNKKSFCPVVFPFPFSTLYLFFNLIRIPYLIFWLALIHSVKYFLCIPMEHVV